MSDKSTYLRQIAPFSALDDAAFADLVKEVKRKKFAAKTKLYHQNYTKVSSVDVIVKGGYEVFFYDQDALKTLGEFIGEGMIYGGLSTLLNKRLSIRTVVVQEGTVVYAIPKNVFRETAAAHPAFAQHFTSDFGHRMLNETYASFIRSKKNDPSDFFDLDRFFSETVGAVQTRKMVVCQQDVSIREAAQIMTGNAVGYLFVQNSAGDTLGYLTDITLRERVLAENLDSNLAVETIMEGPIVSMDANTPIHEAVFEMFSKKIRYVLVEQEGGYSGVLSRNQLVTNHSFSPFSFVQAIRFAQSIDELRSRWEEVPAMVFALLERGVRAERVNEVVTSVSDTIAVKVIEHVLEEKGSPPARFTFMVLGSEGRKEQTLKTDQDNAIIYEDTYGDSRKNVRAYFLDFATRVSEHLDHIGFSFCTGGFMAKNPKWCHSLSHWKENYRQWIETPTMESAVNASTFFDSRRVYGDETLMLSLREAVGEHLSEATPRFFYQMAESALQFEPPLSLFNNFKTFKDGDREVINIKKAMTPVVDIARIYALKQGVITTNNTGERLLKLYELELFQKEDYYQLTQAYYYMMAMRLKRQAKTIIRRQGQPDNFIEPKSLTKIEQVTLKEVFKVVVNFQLKIKMEFKGTAK